MYDVTNGCHMRTRGKRVSDRQSFLWHSKRKHMMNQWCVRIAAIALVIGGMCGYERMVHAAHPKNILFIAIDDLNHWVGHLGRHPQAKTPNIDRLATSGVTFTNAYCTAPACNPSRASLLSGMRPSTTGCYLNPHNWHVGISEDKLLNSCLGKHGYRVYGAGKIYHGQERGGFWDEYFDGRIASPARHPEAKNDGVGGIRFYPLDGRDEDMPDHQVVNWCIEKLQQKRQQPFFIACGLVKPHMPFSVPKKWFDLFPLESIQLPPWKSDDLDDIPNAGLKMAKANGDHADILKSGRWKEAVQAYLATCAFCDYQVGRMLEGLEQSGHRDDTLVVLWSDHGWSLGEKSHWRKFALWEEPTRTVLVWRVPGLTSAGTICKRPVDYLSIYPTILDLVDIPFPAHLEGQSLKPLLSRVDAAWDVSAITTHGRGHHAIRTERWRYIRYANGGEELYDEQNDPLEYENLADRPEYVNIKTSLQQQLPKDEAIPLPERVNQKTRKQQKQKQP